jgi:hypothetical protein
MEILCMLLWSLFMLCFSYDDENLCNSFHIPSYVHLSFL